MSTPDPRLAPIAASLGCDIPAIAAVIAVESAGLGNGLVGGRPLIRLEVHHLWRRVPVSRRGAVDARFHVAGIPVPARTHARVDAPEDAETRPWVGHQYLETGTWHALHQPGADGQALEWRALDVATTIDYAAAVAATSWGLGQVLGVAWEELGYVDPRAFVRAQLSEDGQLRTMAAYIRLSGEMHRALRAHDWTMFARLYNGIGNVPHYSARLIEAYARAGGR